MSNSSRRQHHRTQRRPNTWFLGGLAILSAAALAACSGSPGVGSGGPSASAPSATSTAPAAQAALGVELAADQVPWDQVGPGWVLATWSPAKGLHPGETPPEGQPMVGPATLYLLNPEGGRYPITTFPVVGADPATNNPGHTPDLVAWSGDGKQALFQDQGTCPMTHDPEGWHCTDPDAAEQYTTMTEVDLVTGTQHSFTVDGHVYGAYSRPTGQAILLSSFGNGQTSLRRVDLNGYEQLTFPTDRLGAAGKYGGSYLASPDGTQLVLGAANGLVMVGNDGVLGRQLSTPGLTGCTPVRWWNPGEVLARCSTGGPSSTASHLVRVPVNGGAPTALTPVNSGQDGPNYGDSNAWQLPSGTFLQSSGACGMVFLSKLTADMKVTPVTVPGVDEGNSVSVAGVAADKLVLQAQLGCGSGISLLTYDPAANTSTVLLGPPLNGGAVTDAILYPTS